MLDNKIRSSYIHPTINVAQSAKTMAKNSKKSTKKQTTPLAAALRENVLNSGLSQRKLSAKSGVDYYRLRRILKTKSEPTVDEAYQIQRALKELIDATITQLRSSENNHLALS